MVHPSRTKGFDMLRTVVRRLAVSILAACCLSAPAERTSGQTVWTGLTVDFNKPSFTSPEDFSDAISPSVALTRGASAGLFNIAQESSYDTLTHTSPIGTRWATDWNNPGALISASNWASLEFDTWRTAYGNAVGITIVGEPAVLHLVEEDVYLDIQFSSWDVATGGGFSYSRATGTLPPPPPDTTGDYNLNGIVDAADYTVWRDTFGQIADPPGAGADGDQSGVIDIGDYDFWKVRFGEVVPQTAAAATVPEPAAISLLLAAALGLSMTRSSALRL